MKDLPARAFLRFNESRRCADVAHRWDRERGFVAVYVATFLILLIALGGLALDTAFVRYTTRQLQNAADAGALAAVQEVWVDDPATDFAVTRTAASNVAAANEAAQDPVLLDANVANTPGGDIVVGTWDRATRTFTPGTTDPTAVSVTARRTTGSLGGSVPLLFGNIFGTATSDMSRTATAHMRSAFGPGVIIVLDPTVGRAMQMRGTPFISALVGQIQVNSNNGANALYVNGSPDDPRMLATKVNVVGTSSYPDGSVVPIPDDGADVVADPFATLPYPSTGGMTDYGAMTGPGDYWPGYYPGGVDFNGGVATLNPGVYYIGGLGIDLHGSANMVGDDVMLFLGPGATLTTSGIDSGLNMGAPLSGTYQGISIFAHRTTTASFNIGGSGLFELRGIIYMAGGHLEMHGVVDREIGGFIVNTQTLRGTGSYLITGIGAPVTDPLYPYLVK